MDRSQTCLLLLIPSRIETCLLQAFPAWHCHRVRLSILFSRASCLASRPPCPPPCLLTRVRAEQVAPALRLRASLRSSSSRLFLLFPPSSFELLAEPSELLNFVLLLFLLFSSLFASPLISGLLCPLLLREGTSPSSSSSALELFLLLARGPRLALPSHKACRLSPRAIDCNTRKAAQHQRASKRPSPHRTVHQR